METSISNLLNQFPKLKYAKPLTFLSYSGGQDSETIRQLLIHCLMFGNESVCQFNILFSILGWIGRTVKNISSEMRMTCHYPIRLTVTLVLIMRTMRSYGYTTSIATNTIKLLD